MSVLVVLVMLVSVVGLVFGIREEVRHWPADRARRAYARETRRLLKEARDARPMYLVATRDDSAMISDPQVCPNPSFCTECQSSGGSSCIDARGHEIKGKESA